MDSLLLGVLVGLIPSPVLFWLLIWQARSRQASEQSWTQERSDLLNRCMTKEWQSYQMMVAQAPFSSTSEPPVGLSDEEELRRIGRAYSEAGLGDVLVELDADLAELGIRPDGN